VTDCRDGLSPLGDVAGKALQWLIFHNVIHHGMITGEVDGVEVGWIEVCGRSRIRYQRSA